ncbi:MAG: DUF5703 domain-containing protein, partial [Tepidisphaeraceae bacterium]
RWRLDVTALTAQCPSIESWREQIEQTVSRTRTANIAAARAASRAWWNAFWDRSYIHVTGSKAADQVTQGYVMQRWMTGASGRGDQPLKYNGSIFTVGQEPSEGQPYDPNKGQRNADYRAWGSNYWFQNQRLIYWPMIADGDWDTLWPFFEMYLRALPLEMDRTRTVYSHNGVVFPETMFYFGLPNNNDFGWGNPKREMTNRWIRWHYNNGLELTAMLLDAYAHTKDDGFLQSTLLPLARPIVEFFREHATKVNGKLHFDPAAALETRQQAIDPAPDLAGLADVLPRLIALPDSATTPAERKEWAQMLAELPPLPRGRTDGKGRIPESPATASATGTPVLWPAYRFVKSQNVENPELYAVFPYRLFSVGMPELELAKATFAAREFKDSTCWVQDGIDAACLGDAHQAQAEVIKNFTAFGGERFQWFWRPGHDWEPDLDNGGVGQLILQNMLMQPRADGKVLLFPAWPKEWDVSFKLHAGGNTTIEGVFAGGRLQTLNVTPAERRSDVVVMEAQ